MKHFLLAIFLACASLSSGCYYESIIGTWDFYETERVNTHNEDCGRLGEIVYTKQFTFSFPNVVKDERNNVGTWTLVGLSGFEVNINKRSYYSNFPNVDRCTITRNGWSRDNTVRNWSCYYAAKNYTSTAPTITKPTTRTRLSGKFVNDHNLIKKINAAKLSWKATAYSSYEKYTREEMMRLAGGLNTQGQLPKSVTASAEKKAIAANLPNNFDWRDVNGINYMSPVRNQRFCGSCYIFASMGSIEARLRIETKNQRQDVFSPQDVIECSVLGNGCNGGWPYLIGGRHAMEQGFVEDSCNRYKGVDDICSTNSSCPRTYVSEYEYIGGYYGACNEEEMMINLVTKGPFVTLMNVHDDLMYYRSGIYQHTTYVKNGFNPYEFVNHAVVIAGYGVDEESGIKYWIVKNSWGKFWGEHGYFRIYRGVDECSIESAGMSPIPIP